MTNEENGDDIPAKAGIQILQVLAINHMDPRLRGGDDFSC